MTEVIRPSTQINSAWDTPTVGNIDDPVVTGQAGDGLVASCDVGDDNAEQIYGGFTHATAASLAEIYSEINTITVHIRARDIGGLDTDVDVRVLVNAVWTSQVNVDISAGSFTWYFASWGSGSWDPADVDDIQLGIKVGNNPELEFDVVYIEVDGTEASSGGSAVSSGTRLTIGPRL